MKKLNIYYQRLAYLIAVQLANPKQYSFALDIYPDQYLILMKILDGKVQVIEIPMSDYEWIELQGKCQNESYQAQKFTDEKIYFGKPKLKTSMVARINQFLRRMQNFEVHKDFQEDFGIEFTKYCQIGYMGVKITFIYKDCDYGSVEVKLEFPILEPNYSLADRQKFYQLLDDLQNGDFYPSDSDFEFEHETTTYLRN